MAERRQSLDSRFKILLIPVLGVVLLYALATPPQGPTDVSAVAPTSATTNSPENATSGGPGMSLPEKPSTPTVDWPSIPVAAIIANNPFAAGPGLSPEPPPPPAVAAAEEEDVAPIEGSGTEQEALLAELQSYRVKVIMQTEKGQMALIGDSLVGVGDMIGERLRVTAIRPSGVSCELVPGPAQTR